MIYEVDKYCSTLVRMSQNNDSFIVYKCNSSQNDNVSFMYFPYDCLSL